LRAMGVRVPVWLRFDRLDSVDYNRKGTSMTRHPHSHHMKPPQLWPTMLDRAEPQAMRDFARTWMVIPAFNEARHETIAVTVRSARRVFPNIVVVDDCSEDGTDELALREGAHVCRHPVNLGQGAALMTGIRYALMQGADEIVTFDADGQHSVEDAQIMVRMLRAQQVEVVLG
jgi:Glycosyl transferase family 2